MTDRREVWITGVGLLTCLGEGLEADVASSRARRPAALRRQDLRALHRASAARR